MMDRLRSVLATHAAVGAVVFAATQFALFAASGEPRATDGAGWFLNGGLNVLLIALTLAVAAALIAAAAPGVPMLSSAAATAAGAIAVMAAILFAIGPGTLFPIVLAVGAVVLTIASGLGTVIGRGLRRALVR
jgi:hypothetical protein